MKNYAAFALLALSLVVSRAQTALSMPFACAAGVRYTLLDGSWFVDDCLVCDRPTFLQPLQGTFDLVLLQDTPPYTKYAIRNIDFTADPGFTGEVRIKGSGFYSIFAEFAVIQKMELTTEVSDAFTNRIAYFTNQASVVQRSFPVIDVDLMQTNGTLLQTYSLRLIAAPVRAVWFSLAKPLTTTNASTKIISDGDLLSNRGRVVKSNLDLVGALGVMPMVPDLGLDAVDVIRHGEVLFSINQTVWSETLGPVQHGDLLSNRGRIVKRNQELLAKFGVASSATDTGLDALQLMPDGKILFSIQSDVALGTTRRLGHGDILSDSGQVFRTNRQLLSNFHPAVTNQDYGLDALCVLPTGEIWFSLEAGFSDSSLGPIEAGDVLSDQGYRVFRNRRLVAALEPEDPSADYGLDALFVVTGLRPRLSPPRFWRFWHDQIRHRFCLEWEGDGSVFQVEKALSPGGPWESCSPLLPDSTFEADCGQTGESRVFYRLRQW